MHVRTPASLVADLLHLHLRSAGGADGKRLGRLRPAAEAEEPKAVKRSRKAK